MERMLIKHLSGSKANQVEEFSLKHHNELIFGRDLNASVKFDPDRDDLVGRQHAKISRDSSDGNSFQLADLNSTNGTFLNGQRVTGPVRVNAGDKVQLGPGGPEFVFEIEPRATERLKTTRAVDPSAAGTIPSTRAVDLGVVSGGARAAGGSGGVGKATVERMVSQAVADTKRDQGRKFGAAGAAAGILILLLVGGAIGGGYWYFSRVSGRTADLEKKTAGMSAAEINAKYSKAIVQVEVTWRLIDKSTQSQVYHLWTASENGVVPLYLRMPSGRIEPALRDGKPSDFDKQISGRSNGTGFITKSNGFILTSRTVAAPWHDVYRFPDNYASGLLLDSTTGQQIQSNYRPYADPNWDWVPAESEQTSSQNLSIGSKKKKAILKIMAANQREGTQDLINVTLPGRDTAFDARIVQVSPVHNVALIKVEATNELPTVEIFDSYETLSKGDQTTVMGYSDAGPPVYGEIQAKDTSNPGTKIKMIAEPKLHAGPVSDIRRDKETKRGRTVSSMGDYIVLSLATVGLGASGSPVFDAQGRVIAVFTFGDAPNDFWGVPIRYGKTLGGS